MTCVTIVNEGSVKQLNVVFTDEAGNPFTPATLQCEVICVTTGTIVRAAAAVANPAADMDIELTQADNTLVDRVTNDRELRRVVLTATDAQAKPYVDLFEYYVRRVRLP